MSNNKELESTLCEFFHDFMDMCEKYQHKLNPCQFGYEMIRNTTKMMADLAPSHDVLRKTIQEAVNSGIEWHLEEDQQYESEED